MGAEPPYSYVVLAQPVDEKVEQLMDIFYFVDFLFPDPLFIL